MNNFNENAEGYPSEFDMITITGIETSGERLRISNEIQINGVNAPRKSFPQLRGITKNKTLLYASIESLRLRSGRCPFCGISLSRSNFKIQDADIEDLPFFCSTTSLSVCSACRHWEHLEWRTETYDARALI